MNNADSLIVACLPIDIFTLDKDTNLASVEKMLAQVPEGTDVAVLPELFSTGFVADRDADLHAAETDDGPTIARLKEMAKAHNLAICGSYLNSKDGKLYNRAFFIEPYGGEHFYNKRHLFSISEEAKIFSAGRKHSPIVRFRGWNIALAVCYDLRFPAWLRNKGLQYDVMLLPANWPQSRELAWTTLLQARAIENQAYMVGANRSGTDNYGCYDGVTMICDYMGHNISEPKPAGIVTAKLRKQPLDNFRQKFPAWRDADDISIDTCSSTD